MKRHIHWLRWVGGIVLAILLVLALLIAGILLALRSDTGTRWVIEQVPGLEIRGDQGSLLGRWQAQWLRWHGYGVELELQSPFLDWSPSCLFEKRLCIDVLQAEGITLVVQPGANGGGSEPVQLPKLELPITLAVGDVNLGPLTVNGQQIWTNAQLEASSSGSAWNIDRVYYRLNELEVVAAGRVETRGDWPLDLTVNADLPPPYGESWEVALQLGGSVKDLRISGQSDGYLTAQLQGRTQPLDPGLPAQVQLDSPGFLALDTLPDTLTLQDWTVSLRGSVEQGFETRSRATLPGTESEVQARVQGLLTTTGVRWLKLLLEAPATAEGGTGQLMVDGGLSWDDGMVAEAHVELRQFPWYKLVPGLAAPEVRLETFSADAGYDKGSYQADLQATVSGPLGEASLAGHADGDLESVRLQRLLLTTGGGEARGEAEIHYAGELAWNGQMELQRFNPGYWLPWLQANIDGDVRSSGRVLEEGLQLAADWQLDGEWQGQEAHSQGSVSADQGRWVVPESTLSVGANRLTAEGQWQEEVSASLDLDVPDPSAFLPQLAGALSTRLRVSGRPDALEGELKAEGIGLEWEDSVTLQTLTVTATLSDSHSLDAKATGDSLEFAGQKMDQLAVTLAGSLEQHVLTLKSRQRELNTHLVAAGGWLDGWTGRLTDGLLDLPEQQQRWELQEPMSIAYQPGTTLELGGHCWRWQRSSVCADEQVLLPSPQISYRLTDFPTEALAPLLPDTLRWQSQLNGQLELSLTETGPNGLVNLQANSGSFDVYLGDAWHPLNYEALAAQVMLTPEHATLEAKLAGPEIGAFEGRIQLDPKQDGYPMDGSFNLQGFDLTLLGPLLDFETVSGRLDGSGRLSGPLLAPEVFGELALGQGSLIDPRLPMPLENVAIGVDLKGRSADVQGRWQSNDRSEGLVDGELNWTDTPSIVMNVRGSRLPFSYEPYADVELEPDLTIKFADGSLRVTGELAVPRGKVEVRRLPEQAVTVSEDEVVVGQSQEEAVLRSILMDVVVSVGREGVSFDGFGVLGDLEGTLRLGNDLDARGVLQLTDGTFEAYGQELELRRARLVFVGPLQEPYLDIEAIRRVDAVVAGIRLTGPVSEPQTDVFSMPAMSQGDALSYVILGRPLRSEGDEGQVSQAAISLGLTQASKVTQKIGEEIGIEQLILETEGSGDEASVVASGYLTEDLSLRYGVGIFDPISTVALRYDLGRYFYLEAASGLAASLDIFYTRDF